MKPVSLFVFSLCVPLITADVQEDFSYLVSIFQGNYDNIAQYQRDKHLPPQDRHLHLTTVVTVQDVPALPGRSSFYLEQYLNGTKDNLIRQRIYSFAIDSMNRIDLKLYSLSDQAKFAHAPPYSPLFKTLTANDITYAKGCDVYWTRVDTDFFRSNMFNTCVVPIGGADVLIIDKSTLSSKYLTADETWIFVKNGTVLKVYPGPYNMTKQVVPPQGVVQNDPPASHRSHESSQQLVGFQSIMASLTSGRPVRYYIRASECVGMPNAEPEIGGLIDTFEYFDDPNFGPDPYFGFSTYFPRRNATGHLVIHLREGLIYKTNKVTLRLTTLTADYSMVLDIKNLTCSIGQDTQSGSAFFFTSSDKVDQIKDFQSFRSALSTGGHVRFSINYAQCSLGVNARGGGRIQHFELTTDGQMVMTSQYKVITNYQGEGYVDDIVTGTFYSNGSAIFIASDVKVNTDQAFYKEQIDCLVDGMKANGSVHLYEIY